MKEIFERRSIRKYRDTPVEQDKIERLLRAAMAAPTAMDMREWGFVVVTDPALRAQLGKVHPYAAPAAAASLVIVPVAEKENPFWQQDLGAAVQNILLEAHFLGLGAVWMGIAPREGAMAHVSQTLSLPEGVKPFALLAIGYPDEARPPRGLWEPEKVHYNGY